MFECPKNVWKETLLLQMLMKDYCHSMQTAVRKSLCFNLFTKETYKNWDFDPQVYEKLQPLQALWVYNRLM